ncbi:hypothetical protein [Cellulosimicrobium sp. NPDC057127]|uniref:hypothetical protein n=1 Tax=Cellulosimicrobium sp. NPDC057127 TaxID=3346026 RepID=UPI003633F3D5
MNLRKVRFVTIASSAVLAVGVASAAAGCATESAEADSAPRETGLAAQAAEPADSVLVLGSTDAAELALTASQTFFAAAPVAVLASADDPAAQATAAAAAARLTAPVLLVGGGISDDGVRTELARLGTVAVVEVSEEAPPPGEAADEGAQVAPAAAVGALDGVTTVHLDVDALTDGGELDPRDVDDVVAALPARGEADVLTEVLVLVQPGEAHVAAVATARAAGALPVEVTDGDPRSDPRVVETIAAAKALAVVGIGEGFGSSEDLSWRLRAAETGALLPSGSQLVLAGDSRYVTTTADAVTSRLVALDGDDAEAEIARAVEAAAAYGTQDDRATVPVLEVAATLASSRAGEDGDYSTEIASAELRPFVEAASTAGVHVVLRLEPGRATFAEQVDRYADLLAVPGVGVALDVDARRAADVPGAVEAGEVQAAVDRVAGLVRSEGLPQKLVVVQAPAVDAVEGLAGLDTGDGEVAVVVQSVAAGGYVPRLDAWDDLLEQLPAGAVGGWTTGSSDPALDVEGVLALEPAPRYVAARS